MPPGRRKIELSDPVREALTEQLLQSKRAVKQAERDYKNTVYLAYKAGLTVREISDILSDEEGTISSSTVGNWKTEIEQARNHGGRGHAQRPGERVANS